MKLAPAALAAGVFVSLLLPMSPAAAASDGTLWVLPDKGTVDDAMRVQTDGPCERGSAFVIRLQGKGLPADGANINGAALLKSVVPTQEGDYVVPLSATLRDFAADNLGGKQMVGDYKVVFRCRDRLSAESVGAFSTTISIKANGTWTAPPFPTSRETAQASSGPVAGSPTDAPEQSQTAAPTAGSADPSAPVSTPAPQASGSLPSTEVGSPPVAQPQAQPAAQSDGLRTVLLAGGAVLVALGLLGWLRSRRRAEGGPGAGADAADPSREPDPEPVSNGGPQR